MDLLRQYRGFLTLFLYWTSGIELGLNLRVHSQIIKTNFFSKICGAHVPQVSVPYRSVAGRSRVRCVGLCSLDSDCALVEHRPPNCFLSRSEQYNCTANALPAEKSFYVLVSNSFIMRRRIGEIA